jgi:hypothetical protein
VPVRPDRARLGGERRRLAATLRDFSVARSDRGRR